MTTYEILRLVLILAGATTGTILVAAIAWVVRVERALSAIRSCDNRYEHNVPDLWRQMDGVKDRLGKAEHRISVEMRKANDPSSWHARDQDGKA